MIWLVLLASKIARILLAFFRRKTFSAMNNIDPLSTLMTGWICIGLILI